MNINDEADYNNICSHPHCFKPHPHKSGRLGFCEEHMNEYRRGTYYRQQYNEERLAYGREYMKQYKKEHLEYYRQKQKQYNNERKLR